MYFSFFLNFFILWLSVQILYIYLKLQFETFSLIYSVIFRQYYFPETDDFFGLVGAIEV